MMVKLLVYAYAIVMPSSRRIERATYDGVAERALGLASFLLNFHSTRAKLFLTDAYPAFSLAELKVICPQPNGMMSPCRAMPNPAPITCRDSSDPESRSGLVRFR